MSLRVPLHLPLTPLPSQPLLHTVINQNGPLLPLLSLTKLPSFARNDLDQQNYIEKASCFPSITKGVDLCVYKPLHRPWCFVHKQGSNGSLRNAAHSLKRATCNHLQWAVGCEIQGHPALMAGFSIPTCLSWLHCHFSR